MQAKLHEWAVKFQVYLVIIAATLSGWGLLPNPVTTEPTVFLVENEYQIVWESRRRSAAWVVVDGETFTDNEAGNAVFDRTIHKVSVPIETLDAAGGYALHWQHVMRAYWEVRRGAHMQATYKFIPPDFSDGVQVYHLADTHSRVQPGADTARYWGDKLDLLILNGDITGDHQETERLRDVLKIAWAATGGAHPVLYARGNHELRGKYANDFHFYTGTPSADRWYYTTRFGPLWIAVYDFAEDKADDHEEYLGFADFTQYRARQTEFFENVISNAESEFDAPGVKHRLLVSHTPLGTKREPFDDIHEQWLGQANRMNLDLAVFGHWHDLWYRAPGEFRYFDELPNYAVIVGAKPGGAEAFTATALEFKNGKTYAWFTNEKGEVVREIGRVD